MEFSERGIPILTIREKCDALAICLENGDNEDAEGHIWDLLNMAMGGFVPDKWAKFAAYRHGKPAPIKRQDWGGWVAVLFDDGDRGMWHIAPREFWEKEQCIPDHPLENVPEGFFESSEHCLNSNVGLTKQKKMLTKLGFEIVKWPE